MHDDTGGVRLLTRDHHEIMKLNTALLAITLSVASADANWFGGKPRSLEVGVVSTHRSHAHQSNTGLECEPIAELAAREQDQILRVGD